MKKLIAFSFLFIQIICSYAQYSKEQVKTFYKVKQADFNLADQDLDHFMITDQYTSSHSGVTHIYIRQVVSGIEVFNANSALHIDKYGQVINISNHFISKAAEKINSGRVAIGVATAIGSAGTHVGMNLQAALAKADQPLYQNQLEITDQTISTEPLKVKLYYLNKNGSLLLVYNVEVFDDITNDWWNIRVDAMNGNVLEKNNWTTHCRIFPEQYTNDHPGHAEPHFLNTGLPVKYGKANSGTYHVYPFFVESPNHGERVIIGDQATPNGSPFGWHDTDGVAGADLTTTRGNNVIAKEDTLSGNGNGYSPEGGPDLVFDFPVDTSWKFPASNIDAAITNLFYMNNITHDIFYNYGFNEAAGNFQENNYNKGGERADAVQADAQDGSGTSNANFTAPADGRRGRMQMFLWPAEAVPNPTLKVASPAAIAGEYIAPVSFFGTKRFADITGRLVLVNDSSSNPAYGCNTIHNSDELTGNIALIDGAGNCGFPQRVLNAQNAGAIGVVVAQNGAAFPVAMTGRNTTVIIPSVIVGRSDGVKLKTAVGNGENVVVTMRGLPVVKSFDSDFDNGVIIHEYGHGVSTRLTGGPSNSNCLGNEEQAGEGWSDFFALVLTAKSTDDPEEGKGIGTFVFNQPVTGLGIRDYRYSRNMAINPMTYRYLKNNSEIHYTGTVWCTMLWDIFWDMVDKYGFDEDVYHGTGGNNKTIQLVIDGLKLQACDPGFADSRDAILLADSIHNGGINKALLWNAFARRGLGYSASQGSPYSTTDGVAAFDLPPGVVKTGIPSVNLGKYIQLFPNPASAITTLVLPDQLNNAQLTITDITGKVIMDERVYTDVNQHVTIDMGTFQNGLYFVKLVNGATTYHSKLLLSK